MRIHRLEITGIGPYATHQVIDVDQLTASGLFLLSGPTGAGKTTVLDSIVFALYGTVPGARSGSGDRDKRARERIVSHFRDPSVTPKVVLETTIAGRRFRFTRTPDHERPKTRGEGMTQQKGSVAMEELSNGGWTPRSTSYDEVAQEVAQLLGMSADQFAQVILLPQGEFAGFLRARVEDRRKVLQRLFDVRDFQAAERWLESRAQSSRDELEAHRARTTTAWNRFVGALGEQPPEDENPDARLAWAQERASALLGTLDASSAEAARTAAAASEALTAERAALALRDATASLEQRCLVADELSVRVLKASAWIGDTFGAELAAAQERWRPRSVELQVEAQRLGQLAAREPRVAQLAEQAKTFEQRAEQAEVNALKADEQVATSRQAEQQATELATKAGVAEQHLAGARDEQRKASERVKAAGRRDVALRERADAEAAVRSADEAAKARRSAHLDAREARLDGMAAELASQLEDDAPCPVCGGLDHPAPAGAGGGDPLALRTAEQQARAAFEQAEQTLQIRERELAAAGEQLAAALAQAGNEPVDVLHGELERRTHVVKEIQAQAAAAAAAREDSTRHQRAAREASERSSKLRSDAAALREQARAAAQASQELAAELTAARGEETSLADAAGRLATQASHLQAAAKLVDDRLHELAEVERAVAALGESSPPDAEELQRLTAAREQTHAEAAAASGAAQEAKRRAGTLATHLQELTTATLELGPVAETAERVIRLDQLVRGIGSDNARRVSLTTYVLAARLEQVAAAATTHLQRMSAGRYELVHHDERYGNAQAGLGLRVRDGHTGTLRDTDTLSGGEAFYASLALALGLAEVVTNESGGRPMETLLVDEGFGSLDPQTLDDVIGELEQLRASGRAIGIVSHVESLAERIPAQLRVTPGRDGSTVSVAIGGRSGAASHAGKLPA